jgi:hypothetical protein
VVQELVQFTDHDLVRSYVNEAVWFWFDASTVETSFQGRLHRLMAHCIRAEIRRRGLEETNDDQVYVLASKLLPPDDLHRR